MHSNVAKFCSTGNGNQMLFETTTTEKMEQINEENMYFYWSSTGHTPIETPPGF